MAPKRSSTSATVGSGSEAISSINSPGKRARALQDRVGHSIGERKASWETSRCCDIINALFKIVMIMLIVSVNAYSRIINGRNIMIFIEVEGT